MKSLALAAAITVTAQNTTSFCDKYTTALFTNNTAENQLTLLTAVVNTAVIGNYSESKTGKAVSGILAKGTYEGVEVDLLPYFNVVFSLPTVVDLQVLPSTSLTVAELLH